MQRTTSIISFSVLGALALCACGGPAIGVTQMGAPRTPKPPDCSLDFVTVTPGDMAPGAKFGAGGEYEMIGAVSIGASSGTKAMSEEIRKIIRPRACGIGGEAVAILASGTDGNGYGYAQQSMVFQVWAHRQAPPSTPPKF